MKEKIIYVCDDGTRFDKKEDAKEYDDICCKIESIMLPMGKRTDRCESGKDYIIHDPKVVKDTLSKFLIECSHLAKWGNISKIFIECASGIRHISHAEYYIGEMNMDVLSRAMFRFSCTNMESGREYQQPYYALHESEFDKFKAEDYERSRRETYRQY